jgi:predicted ester cyclase
VSWNGSQPHNQLHGCEKVLTEFWRPLRRALPDLTRQDDIILTGEFREGQWLACTGHLIGTFVADFIGIRATGGVVTLRYGEFSRLAGGRVVEVYVIFDWLDLMRQAAQWPSQLPRALGVVDRVPAPATQDGLTQQNASIEDGRQSLQLVEAMIAGLMQYDRRSLASMGMVRFWQPNMMWYGPAAIGTARGLGGFERCHQIPFLTAFPDRVGGDHKCRIGQGAYVASTGWPSIRATHAGVYLGVPTTHRRITMRVMDFWRREADLLAENWVFIDIPDLLLQFGVVVLPAHS